MKLQFDANQQYQLDAVAAVTGLFDGQPQDAPEYARIEVGDWGGLFAGQTRTELGVGNHLLLAPDKLLINARAVQGRNDIEIADPAVPLESWELFDTATNEARTRAEPSFCHSIFLSQHAPGTTHIVLLSRFFTRVP